MEAVFGPNSDLDWGMPEHGQVNQAPTFKLLSLSTPSLQNENIVKKQPPSRSRKRPRPKSNQVASPLPKSSEENMRAPPTHSSWNSATTLPSSNCPTLSNCPPTHTSSNSPPTNSSNINSALDAFDILIAPQLIHPPNATPSCIIIRRFLYRKHYHLEVSRLIQSSLVPIVTIDQLVEIIVTACNNLGIYLT